MLALTVASAPTGATTKCRSLSDFRVSATGFPSFLPKEVERIKDPFARNLAQRIERLPVQVNLSLSLIFIFFLSHERPTPGAHKRHAERPEMARPTTIIATTSPQISFSEKCIMSSCVKPLIRSETNPVVLLHGFDSSCLEWRCTYPLLEEAGLETWALDVLGWGFSDLERLPSCNVKTKRDHLFQLWKSYIKRPMILVGPSLGAAVAIDFAVNHSEAVEKLILIDASVYAEGTGNLTKLPRTVAYAGVSVFIYVSLLKSLPLRLYASFLAFNSISFTTSLDWTNVGRLHCLLPWWEDATVDFMISGGYNVCTQIKQVKQETLIIWGEDDNIISNKLAVVSSFLEL
ncbi:hypothetical protein HHK36_007345 [Tetracentron sinense]|uniref:AB hydrolase-1 domain-containing protein n=1 Tax=Tetracentron sinense TaxID=13715 RepID=A0A834ZTD1_TETSI|nr:hypothetical protein HHK36_007345 [Tetracentron sinense]